MDLVLRVREESGRPMDDAALERVRKKILALTQAEATAERALLRRLLVGGKPDRDQP